MLKLNCALVTLAVLCSVAGCSSSKDKDKDSGPAAGANAPGGTGTGAKTAPGGGGTGASAATGDGGGVGGGAGGTGGDPSSAGNDSWPMMGYDEHNWYFNPNEKTLTVANAPMLVEKWRFTTAGFPPGTPTVGDGKVFVMATMGTYGIDLETGKEAWARLDLPGTASVAFEPGFVYVHDSKAQLWKLNSADGKTVWGPSKTYDLAGADGTSSPILGGGKVLVGHSTGTLEVGFSAPPTPPRGGVEAHNTSDGKKAWTYFTAGEAEDGAMVWSSVGIDVAAGVVYAGSGNNYKTAGTACDAIHAIDLATGMKKWVKQVRPMDTWSIYGNIGGPDTDFGANPIIAEIGGKSVVAAGDKGSAFWALDRDGGEILWSREGLSAARDAAHGGFLMNGAFDGKVFYGLVNDTSDHHTLLYAMNGEDGKDLFPARAFAGKYAWGAPSLANGLLVAPIDTELHVMDAATGKDLKMFETGGTIAGGAAAIVAGKIIVGSGLAYPLDSTTKMNNQVICYGLP